MMKRFLPLFILTGLLFGQDTLITISRQVATGKYIETTDNHIIFHIDGNAEPSLIMIESVENLTSPNFSFSYTQESDNIITEKLEKPSYDSEVNKKLKTAQSKGIAISFNPNFTLSNLSAGSASLVDPTFYYVFKKGNISLEPAIGFMSVNEENDYGKSKSSIMTIGLGLLMQKSDTTGLSPYYGLRLARTTISEEVNYNDEYDDYLDSDSDSESALSIAPVYGLEYYVNKHFSISGELQLNYFKPEEDEDGGSFTQTEIMSKLFFRFYF